jgi:hypothetical protein
VAFSGVGDFEGFGMRCDLKTVLRLKPPRFRYKHLSSKKSKEKTLEVYDQPAHTLLPVVGFQVISVHSIVDWAIPKAVDY